MNIDNENNLLNQEYSLLKKVVYNLTTFTHLDFPNHLACIVWMVGCNMRCDYCYNKDIVFSKEGELSFSEVLSFLEKRVGLLDGIVLSGGEATLHSLIPFCKEIKKLGFKIKLDTNGLNFNQIQELIELNLLDYIALDYKAPAYKFKDITHSNQFVLFSQTLDMLIKNDIEFEVRTTVHNDLLNEDDINFICTDLIKRGYDKIYYLQSFLETNNNIGQLNQSSKIFDKLSLSNKLKIVWR